MSDWLTLSIATYVGLLPIVNPFSTAVVFLSLTARFPRERQQQQAKMACVWAASLLIVFMLAGAVIMSFFGITLHAVQLAGGLIVARIGFGMLQPEPDQAVSDDSRMEALAMEDVAFTPLAMPMMSGPGAIAVVIGMSANADVWWENSAIAVGILMVAFSSWLVLRAAERVVGYLGATGVSALSRIMGFLLVCVGVQFIGTAIIEVVTDERFLGAIVDAIGRNG